MRENDVFGRFGGEEFIALLPHTDKKQAVDVAQRVRKAIDDYSNNIDSANQVSVSIGAATYSATEHENFEALLRSADVLLYQAKAEGRNKVCA